MRPPLKLADPPARFLALLLLGDAAFIALHLLHAYSGLGGEIANPLYLVGLDRGYAEYYQYLKELWIAALLLLLAAVRARLLYGSWCLLFLYFLLDDSLEIHEKLGVRLAEALGIPALLGLRPQDLGELGVSLFFGVVLLGGIAIAHFRSAPADRAFSRLLALLVAVLAFFGVALDMLDIAIYGPSPTSFLDVVENGGEMVVMSVMAWHVFER